MMKEKRKSSADINSFIKDTLKSIEKKPEKKRPAKKHSMRKIIKIKSKVENHVSPKGHSKISYNSKHIIHKQNHPIKKTVIKRPTKKHSMKRVLVKHHRIVHKNTTKKVSHLTENHQTHNDVVVENQGGSLSAENKANSRFHTEKEVAMDFATKIQRKFDHLIKATILFGSQVEGIAKPGSDIDMVIIIDDAAINWDMELTAWYREELAKLISAQSYERDLHINTIRLTTWWRDLLHGDPVVLNILRQGQVLIDIGGFFSPIKSLLIQGKIHSTPEAVYAALQRSPQHLMRSKMAILGSIEGVYWCMVEASQAALITLGKLPPSPEHITKMLHENFVETGVIKSDFVKWYHNIYTLHKQIAHGETRFVPAREIEEWQQKAETFMKKMVEVIDRLIEARKNNSNR